jgi:hypothetical protein
MLTEVCPAEPTVIAPAHAHEHWDESSSAGVEPIVTAAEPGVHGLKTGTQDCGVSVPIAAAVALATWGFASDEHMPNPGTLLGEMSLTTPEALVAVTSVPVALKVAGVVPKEHWSDAPVTTWVGMAQLGAV